LGRFFTLVALHLAVLTSAALGLSEPHPAGGTEARPQETGRIHRARHCRAQTPRTWSPSQAPPLRKHEVPVLFEFPKRFQAPASLLLPANVHHVERFTEQIGQPRPVQFGISSLHL
jgi:hypothetical protein